MAVNICNGGLIDIYHIWKTFKGKTFMDFAVPQKVSLAKSYINSLNCVL